MQEKQGHNQLLSKPERLKKSSEFSNIYRLKKSVANSLLILYVGNKKRSDELITRAGFVVSKKISKRAVKRNRIKRLIRESYKEYCCKNNIPWDRVIFIARANCLDADYEKVKSAVNHSFNKALKQNL